jgi:hypothetical protein
VPEGNAPSAQSATRLENATRGVGRVAVENRRGCVRAPEDLDLIVRSDQQPLVIWTSVPEKPVHLQELPYIERVRLN